MLIRGGHHPLTCFSESIYWVYRKRHNIIVVVDMRCVHPCDYADLSPLTPGLS